MINKVLFCAFFKIQIVLYGYQINMEDELTIKCCIETDNAMRRKKTDVWKYFGRIYKDNIQIDDYFHCIVCFNEKKLPVK